MSVVALGRNRLWVVVLGLGLTACGKTLDSDRLAQTIQQDVIKQGGLSLKTVTCPLGIKPKAGATFECVGELDTGYTFTIPVKQQDTEGSVVWDIPHAKGLLNLAKLETLVQDTLKSEMGDRPLIRCGTGYKSVKPGETFDCQIELPKQATDKTNKTAKSDKNAGAASPTPVEKVDSSPGSKSNKKSERVVVTIEPNSNVSWQRVIPGLVAVANSGSNSTATSQSTSNSQANPDTNSDTKTAAQPADSKSAAASTPMPPAQQNANDFLDQPGASEGFED